MIGAPYHLRPVTEPELDEFFAVMFQAFGDELHGDTVEHERLTLEIDRTLAAVDGEAIVGTAGAESFDLAVPGGRLPAAGVTMVAVATTHRRRGILSALMRRQLNDIRDRGEPIAVLWASEAAIYGRYGYGPASHDAAVEVDRVDARLRPDVTGDPDVALRLTPLDHAAEAIKHVDETAAARPGTFARSDGRRAALLADPAWRRHGFGPLRCVVAWRAGVAAGFALYRTKSAATVPYDLPDGEVLVVEQQACSAGVDVELTRFLLSVDLMRRVRWRRLPTDTPLPYLLTDPRQARTTILDALHLRVVDLPVALRARRYRAPVEVVMEVTDALCPWNTGRWRLTGDRSGASCDRTSAEPDLRLDVEALGAAYLGGTPIGTLAATGRIGAASEAALTTASTAFGWAPLPWCPMTF